MYDGTCKHLFTADLCYLQTIRRTSATFRPSGGPLLVSDNQADLCYLQTLRLTSDTSRTYTVDL